MKRTAKAASKKGFTLIELVVVVAIIGVLAGLLVPTMFDAVTNSRIASAQQTAKVIRDRSAEFFTKMDTQMHTYVGEVQKVVITVDNGTWSMTGGSAADWVDGVNHWNTLPGVSDPGNDRSVILNYTQGQFLEKNITKWSADSTTPLYSPEPSTALS